ncbi:MAG: hypothetical protein PHP42_07880, partial [Bacteroidota bacterium]|nr:hypothetical protein [Bacteroidota bacterium]
VTTYCRALKEAAIVNLHTPLALAALKFQHNLPKGTHLKYFYSLLDIIHRCMRRHSGESQRSDAFGTGIHRMDASPEGIPLERTLA